MFFNSGPFVFQAEYDWFSEDGKGGDPDLNADGWYVQAGYIFHNCWEIAARHQNLEDPINTLDFPDGVEWTSIGLNYYMHEHKLKVQMDYTWKNEAVGEIANDVFQMQLQLDF
jgi:hypothetical protein